MTEWERTDESMPSSQSLKRSGCPRQVRRRSSRGSAAKSVTEYVGFVVRQQHFLGLGGTGWVASRAVYPVLEDGRSQAGCRDGESL